jgi:hypothetical protein
MFVFVGVKFLILDNLPVKDQMSKVKERVRQDECEMCFRHDFKYVIDNPNICDVMNKSQVIDLVIMIFTEHENRAARDAIRQTWISVAQDNSKTSNIRYAFLLGYTDNERASEDVLQESSRYGDIIKEDFLDSYQNLTYKTVMAYKWASTKCARAKYVMKTDNDMFVNIPALMKLLRQNGDQLQHAITGKCLHSWCATPIRNTRSKWFASIESYPHNSYPGFCSGTGYVTSGRVAKSVYEISHTVPFFHVEDVYVGLCINKLGFKVIDSVGFAINWKGPIASYYTGTCKHKSDDVITIHEVAPSTLINMWSEKCQWSVYILYNIIIMIIILIIVIIIRYFQTFLQKPIVLAMFIIIIIIIIIIGSLC